MQNPLSPSDLNASLIVLNTGLECPWLIEDGKLTKTFTFPNFKAAFAFITRVADIAETMNHHPDWTNVYNRVEIKLNTHDAGGITQLDFDLATKIESLNHG